MKITHSQLAEILAGIDHAQPFSFSAFVNALARKGGCPFAEVRKLSVVNPFVGTSYQGAVNRQLEREGSPADFVAQSPRYRYLGGALVEYISTHNLCVAVQFNASNVAAQARKPLYFAKRDAESPWLMVAHESVRQWTDKAEGASATQGTVNPILWRTYGLANILSANIGGKRYSVRG